MANKSYKKSILITGILIFENKKTLIRTENEDFFVRGRIPKNLIHGDTVSGKIIKKIEGGRLQEVQIVRFLKESTLTLLGRKIKNFIIPTPGISTFSKIPVEKNSQHFGENILVEFQMHKNTAKILKIFENSYEDERISSVLFLNQISENWNKNIQQQIKKFKTYTENFYDTTEKIPKHFLLSKTDNLDTSSKNNPDSEWAKIMKNEENFSRISLENWFTFTIDGRDAKDLDDAISIAKYTNGDFLLGVHIADVSYFVTEKSALDKEAYNRGTSIYLPDRVIPMLPEILSNSLCSLNTDNKKLSLSCIMHIHGQSGKVLHTDIFPSIIKSQHRGIYEEIFENYTTKTYHNKLLQYSTETAFELFYILQNRRKSEGKIHFETTELYFDLKEKIPTNIKKRERNDVHLLIEEFMVLANEEVAKWCTKRKIPFLSRVHHAPTEEAANIIHTILEHPHHRKNTPIEPSEIENFLSSKSTDEKYFFSRLILPKMSKACYAYNQNGHFGLALKNYSHFTSPIRRYPDLITHRMIHAYLGKKLDKNYYEKAEKILPKIALSTSNSEKRAENIERAVEKIYILEHMKQQIGKIFDGKISGITEWGIFLELENGIEVTVYLSRNHHFQLDEHSGSLINKNQQKIFQIGEKMSIIITKILEDEGRIVAEWTQNK